MSHPDPDPAPANPLEAAPAKPTAAPIAPRRPVASSSQLKFTASRGAYVAPTPAAPSIGSPALPATVLPLPETVVPLDEPEVAELPEVGLSLERQRSPAEAPSVVPDAASSDLHARPTVLALPALALPPDTLPEGAPTVRRVVRGGAATVRPDSAPPPTASRAPGPDLALDRTRPGAALTSSPSELAVDRRARAAAPTELRLPSSSVAASDHEPAAVGFDALGELPVSPPRGRDFAADRPTPGVGRVSHAGPATRPAGAVAVIVATVAFVGALVLPTADATPWALVLYPTGVGFHALVMVLMLTAVGLSGLAARSARVAYSVVGTIGLVLAWLVMRDAVAADAFDGQPAVFALWHGGGAAGGVLAAGVAFLGAGVYARMNGPRSVAPIVWLGLGLVAVATTLFTAGSVDGVSPIGSLVESFAKTAFVGDRIAAFALVPAVVLLVPILLVFKRDSLAAAGSALAIAVVLAWALPVLVLALFVSTASAWTEVLAPLKVVLFLVGTVALAAMAGGWWGRSEA